MGLNLSNIYQRPYIRNNGQGYVRPKRDEETSSSQTQREEQASQNGRSKGLLYTENRDEFSRNAYCNGRNYWYRIKFTIWK